MTPRKKNSHCSHCGSAYAEAQAWPRTCGACSSVSYLNPLLERQTGILMLFGAACSLVTGLFVIRRIVAIKV